MAKKKTPELPPASPPTDKSLLEQLFSPNPPPKGDVRLTMSESEGVIRVCCLVSGRGAGFRNTPESAELYQFCKEQHEATTAWEADERKKALAEASKQPE